MHNFLKTPDQFQSYCEYKFVRFTDGTILFCEAFDMNVSHKSLVLSRPDLTPLSAGKIKVKLDQGKRWTKSDGGSLTAKSGGAPGDSEALAKFLGDEWVEDYKIVNLSPTLKMSGFQGDI